MVGGGPAGCAAAIVLARGGAKVVVLERSAPGRIRAGETLPPDSRQLLDDLGVSERFEDGGHTPSPGIRAAWGQAEPYENDFLLNPYGCGWHVDRNRFDTMLACRASDAGAVVLTGIAVDRCGRAAGGTWELAVNGGDDRSSLTAAFVVDATGRSSAFCRALGGRRVVYDRMIALVACVTPAPGATSVDRRALIEATEEGWWYSAPLTDGRLVLAFQTDAGAGRRARWPEYLRMAPVTAGRAPGAAAAHVRVVPANSQRTEPMAGDAWLAVGDAAAAHDPLSGLGIHWALESGIRGAEAILAGSPTAMEAYRRDRHTGFDRYLVTRTQYYRAERRWPDAPFWLRRHASYGWS